jgi:hypothetical protein
MTQAITISTAAGGLFSAFSSTIAFLSSESTILLALSRIGIAYASSESASSLMTLASAADFSTISFSALTILSFSSATNLSLFTYVSVIASSSFAFASLGNMAVMVTLRLAIEAFVFFKVVRPLPSLFLFALISFLFLSRVLR